MSVKIPARSLSGKGNSEGRQEAEVEGAQELAAAGPRQAKRDQDWEALVLELQHVKH